MKLFSVLFTFSCLCLTHSVEAKAYSPEGKTLQPRLTGPSLAQPSIFQGKVEKGSLPVWLPPVHSLRPIFILVSLVQNFPDLPGAKEFFIRSGLSPPSVRS